MSNSYFSKQETMPILSKKDISTSSCPKKIGPYNIQGLFSKGGMSLLYLGTDSNFSKPLIIKVLPPKYAKDKEMVNRFLKEAEIINISNHPNIIKLYGQGTWEQGLYIATELVQGISLRQFLQNKAFSTKKALEIILQVAYALCHLHSHKIIHRDLKPENILITESGEIKVIDFGIAQLKTDQNIEDKNEKKIIGTPVYMSPEQKKDPSSVSFQTDIFSLGIIIYELVLGRLSHGKVDLSLLPKKLNTIVGKTLEKDLSKRYQNVVEFITDIGEYIKKLDDNSHKEQSNISEMIGDFDKISKNHLPKKLHTSDRTTINITRSKNELTTGIYTDYFPLSEDEQLLVFAETVKSGMKSVNDISILKAIITSTIHHLYADKKNITNLSLLSSSINEILLRDKNPPLFSFSALLFCFDTNKVSYISLGKSLIFHVNDETKKINTFTTAPCFLGDKNKTPPEGSCSWNNKDKLFICSSEIQRSIKIKNHTPLKNIISANIIFPAKLINTKIIEQTSKELPKIDSIELKDFKKNKVVISIERNK